MTNTALVDLIDENQSFIFKHNHAIEACGTFGERISSLHNSLDDLSKPLRNKIICKIIKGETPVDYLEPEHWDIYDSFIENNDFRPVLFDTMYIDSKPHFEDEFEEALDAFLAPYIEDCQNRLPMHRRRFTLTGEWNEWGCPTNNAFSRVAAKA